MAQAQQAPDAGSLTQQMQRSEPARTLAAPQSTAAGAQPVLPALREDAGLHVTASRFRLDGNTLLPRLQLEAVVQPYLDRPLDFQELQAAAAAVAGRYRQDGWVVRVYLPQQDLAEGVVVLQVLETRYAGLQLEPQVSEGVSLDQVQSIFDAHLEPGQPLNQKRLERALLLVNEQLGVHAEATLLPGDAPQTTRVLVTVADAPRLLGAVSLDNYGADSTGANRISSTGGISLRRGSGDSLEWSLADSEGSDYVRLGYSLPIGGGGWRVGLNGSAFNYRLVSDELAPLHAAGSSGGVGLEASYPLVREPQRDLRLSMAYDERNFDNRANGYVESNYKSRSAALGLSGYRLDAEGSNNVSGACLNLVDGELDLGGSPNQMGDALTTRSAGHFTKLRYCLWREQELTPSLALHAKLSGQIASRNLDSSEKLYVGGPDGVRAFSTGEAGGSEGNVLNLELRWRLQAGWSVSAFYDWAQVQINHDNQFVGAPVRNRFELEGAGLGLTWQGPAGLNLKASWARRTHSNPNATASGSDQDGSFVTDRLWLSANLLF